MTEPQISRRYHDHLTLRAEPDSDGRTVYGLAVPFDVPTRIADWQGTYEESFTRGSFKKTIQEQGSRVKLLAHHDTRMLLGGRPTLTETDEGLIIEASIARTRDGDDVLELIRAGALDSFSIGFSPVKGGDDWNDDMTAVTRREVRLHEVSLVPFPAYETALVGGTRTTSTTPSRAGDVAATDTAPPGMSAHHINRNRIAIRRLARDRNTRKDIP
jgi:HK97 family phage prohead protease